MDQDNMNQNNNEQTGMEQNGINQPNMEQPTMAQPSVEQPSMAQPSVEQPSMVPPNIVQTDFSQEQPKKKSKVGLVVIVIVLLLACAGAGAWYFLIFNSPKNIFTSIVDSESKKILNEIEVIDSDSGDSLLGFINKHDNLDVNLTTDLKLKINDQEITNKSDIDVVLNKAAKKLKSNFNIELNDKKFLDLSAILSKNKLNFKLKDFSKYYYLDEDIDFDQLYDSANSTKDGKVIAKKLISYLQSSLNESIDESLITSINEKTTVNNEEIDAVKYTIVINNDLLVKILKNYTGKVKADSELISLLAKITNNSESNIKELLTIKEDKKYITEDVKFNYYVKDRNLVLLELVGSTASLSFSDYKSNYIIKVVSGDQIGELTAIKSGEEYNVSVKYNNKEYLSGKVKVDKNDIKYDLDINLQEYGKLTLSGSEKDKKDGNTFSVEGNVNIKYALASYNIELSLGYTSKIGEGQEISDSEVGNSRPIEEMSEADQKVIEDWIESLSDLGLGDYLSMFGISNKNNDIDYSDYNDVYNYNNYDYNSYNTNTYNVNNYQ